MIRELTSHKVNGCNEHLKITVMDEPGSGGACHHYHIAGFNTATNSSHASTGGYGEPAEHATVLFQNGTIPENGANGVTHEAILAILIDRMEGFQSGAFATIENHVALDHLRAAQATLKFRTEQRVRRGVEGSHKQ